MKGEMKKVEEYRFEELYGNIKDVVSAYSDSGEREAAIAGYMRCMDPDEVLTIEQINMILALWKLTNLILSQGGANVHRNRTGTGHGSFGRAGV